MIEIYPKLYVGPEEDYYDHVKGKTGWYVVQAANEPFHRDAIGYHGSSLSSDHPEYLFARREKKLILNLVDAPIEVDIPKEIFDSAVNFINESLQSDDRVLVHCNEGVSRSASIALLYLFRHTEIIPNAHCEEGMKFYEEKIYPPFNPGKAMRYYLENHWLEYANPVRERS